MIVIALVSVSTSVDGQTIFESRSVTDAGSQPARGVVASGRLYVTSLGGSAIESFPLDRECALDAPVSVGAGTAPLALAVNGSGTRLYATLFSDDALGAYTLEAGEIEEIARYPTGQGPVDVVVTRDPARVFASNVFDGTVRVFDETPDGLAPVETLEVGGRPNAMALDASGRFLFVADEIRPVIETFRIDGGTVRSASRYLMRAPALDLEAHPSEPVVFASQGTANRILSLDIGARGQLELTAAAALEGVAQRHDEPGGPGRTAPFPGALVLDPRSGILFVAGRLSADVHAYRVGSGFEPLGSYPAFEYPEDLVFDAPNRCLYVISSAYGQILGMKVLE